MVGYFALLYLVLYSFFFKLKPCLMNLEKHWIKFCCISGRAHHLSSVSVLVTNVSVVCKLFEVSTYEAKTVKEGASYLHLRAGPCTLRSLGFGPVQPLLANL